MDKRQLADLALMQSWITTFATTKSFNDANGQNGVGPSNGMSSGRGGNATCGYSGLRTPECVDLQGVFLQH